MDGAGEEAPVTLSSSDPIQGGQLETGVPAVGEVSMDFGFCTGTLITPSYVLTAAHCAGSGMVFKTGTQPADFVSHAVDRQIIHPSMDLMIVHLASPLTGVPLIPFNDGALPAVNDVCTAVGYGAHDENGGTTYEVKRSATEQVDSADASLIVVHMVSGIADHGDSGGPLLCGGRIAGVVHNHTDGNWPQHVVENYVTVDPAWITSTVAPVYSELALQNGWSNAPFATRRAGVAMVSGIVHFKGAISGGTSAVIATLPVAFRPTTDVYVPVDLCNSANGRLLIQSSGAVSVQTEGPFSDAQCFTSLEGASFAPSSTGFTGLALQNGWVNAPFGTSNAAVANVGGIVHFKGAIANGASTQLFTLPVGFRPSTPVYVAIDLCNSTNGRLLIQTDGTVFINTATFSNATCFTSLDGAWFAQDTSAFSGLALQNGWTGAPFGTGTPGIDEISGVAHLKGAIASGANGVAFTLPAGLHPATAVYVQLDLCNATNGRLVIQPSGVATVEAQGGTFGNAQCFTSLDGVSFAISDFTPLALAGSWGTAPFGNADPAFALISGIMHFKGAMSTGGTDSFAFSLPVGFRPAINVYVPVDLCNATKGRLNITPSGSVFVQAENGAFSNAQCFTSLDGASFALTASGFTGLALQSGWTNGPYGTRNAAVINDNNVVRLQGAIANGTSSSAFTLPVGLRPATNVYLPIDLCNAAKGRLFIQPSGAVSVLAEGAFSGAQCFTSLEGAQFSLSGGTALALQNGWTNAPFATRNAVATSDAGIIRLQGAIASGTTTAPFTLPAGFRPSSTVWIPIDLCNATNGRLILSTSGAVTIDSENGAFANAQCFTSLEGAWFAQ